MAGDRKRDEMETDEDALGAKKKSRFSWGTFAVAAGILVVQVAVVGLVMLLSSGPSDASASGGGGATSTGGAAVQTNDVEELIVDGKATNTKRGVTFFYRYQIYVLVSKEDLPALRALVEKRKATLEDRVRSVVARLEPKHLDDDPDKVTLKRMLQEEFDQILGPGKIKSLVIPEWSPIRADY